MSDQEKAKLIENYLPSIQSIMDEYKAQGKMLTTEEAEGIREQIRKDMESGHIDAMENVLSEDALDEVIAGIAPAPTKTDPVPTPTPTGTVYQYDPRP